MIDDKLAISLAGIQSGARTPELRLLSKLLRSVSRFSLQIAAISRSIGVCVKFAAFLSMIILAGRCRDGSASCRTGRKYRPDDFADWKFNHRHRSSRPAT